MNAGISSFSLLISLFLVALDVSAACPVGKQGGGTWCEKGWEWKCEKCGSEYCPIMTGRKCVRDDAEQTKVNLRRFLDESAEISLLSPTQRQRSREESPSK